MRVLIACEYSGRVRDAFLALGHDAWSCDLLPSEADPARHVMGDCWDLIYGQQWDLIIAHPPCTHLSSSGAKHWAVKRADGRQAEGCEFFMRLTKLECRWAIENPIGIMSSVYRKPDQIIHPWQYGHGETKATCLWLNGLPLLTPTDVVEGREAKCHRMPAGPDRWKNRSRTYQGIANAMAAQWGSVI